MELLTLVGRILFTTLVYPGLIFLVTVGLLSQWYRRKLVARLQNRIGPKYVGPIGILQPFADIYKLLFVKELVTGYYTPAKLIMYVLTLGIVTLAASTIFLPITPYSMGVDYDVLVFIYLTLYASIAYAIVGFGSVSPYPGFGGVRYTTMMAVFEPAAAISLIAMVRALAPESLSIYEALSRPRIVGVNNLLHTAVLVTVLVTAGVALSISLLSKTMMKPFDIPEAETEVAGGYLAELSGPALGLGILLHEVELALYVLVLSNLLIPLPPMLSSFPEILLSLLKYFIVLTVLIITAYSMGRVRLDQALRTLVKVPLPLSIFSLALSFLL
ncbi:MAG: complex I subunit 1 family protein [Sulfolobales archaeon]|nr:NADH-quinone oxidoreductase subunit H [Sulfolobales archaeon]MDW8083349.1 complex I subunit 1 family protein [Sulfolobales archaeon]